MADEETPAKDADTPVEETPAEEADPEVDAVDAGAGDAAAPSDAQPGDGVSGIKARGVARAAAVVAGAVVAGAAAIVGAVWAIAAIVGDDDDYRGDCCVVDYATSFDPDGKRGAELGPIPRADRGDRYERFERDRRDRREHRQERRDQRERAEREERKKRGDGDGATGHEPGESPDSGLALEGGECETILSFGTGDDAVTILVCNAPGAEWRGFEPDGDGDYFQFRKRPRGFRFSPFSGPYGEWPFQDGWAFRDGRPFEDGAPFRDGKPFEDGWAFRDGRPFEDGAPFRNGVPFDLEELYERFFQNGLPFDSERFEGFEDLFGDDERGFRFRRDGEDGRQGSFCFRAGDEEECFSDLDQLSESEREQFEQMMEMLGGFGLGGLFGGLEEFLDGLEFEFPESRIDPSGVAGA